jgi:hypothetical protein
METKVKQLHPENNVISDDKQKQDKQMAKLSAAIGVAVEMESNFKLFSYRIIDQDTFISKVEDLIQFYQKKNK